MARVSRLCGKTSFERSPRSSAAPHAPGVSFPWRRPDGEDGQSFTEYALIMAMVVVAALTAVVQLGGAIDSAVVNAINGFVAAIAGLP